MNDIRKTFEVDKRCNQRQAYCSRCLQTTNHDTLYAQTIRWGQEIGDGMAIDGTDIYSLVQCRGCDNIRLLHEHWFSEDWDEEGPVKYSDYYPPNIVRQRPDWLFDVRTSIKLYELRELLQEIYSSMGVRAYRVAMMGIRALVERMMIEKVGDNGSFEKNIDQFFANGFVAGFQQKMFKDTLIEAGHAAMHRGWEPSGNDVSTLLDIVEALIKSIYIDPEKTSKITASIPPRTPRPPRRNQGPSGG